jgi:hypothetical protein
MEGKQTDYLSYLLRLWRVGDGDELAWRAWLKSARTGQQVGFGSLEELFEFLQGQTSFVEDRDGCREYLAQR